MSRVSPNLAGWLAAGCVMAAQWVAGCVQCEREAPGAAGAAAHGEERSVPSVPLGLRLTKDDVDFAKELASRVQKQAFPEAVVDDETNANLFIYLAANGSSPDVIVAALRAMPITFDSAHRRKSHRLPTGDAYGTVVALRLQSERPRVLAAALAAARPVLTGARPYGPVIDELSAIAQSHPDLGAQVRAIKALGEVSGFQQHEGIVRTLLHVLEFDRPVVLVTALQQAARHDARGLLDPDAFREHAIRLIRHSDPAVRGRAARLAILLAPKDVAVAAAVVGMLHDTHPCARAFAARALIDTQDARAIHPLMPLVADMANARYLIRYQDLNGRQAKVAHFSKTQPLVHDRAIRAITALSQQTPVPFSAPTASAATSAQAEQRTADAARQWYAAHRSQLPPAGPLGEADAERAATD